MWEGGFAILGFFKPGDRLKSNLEMARRMNVDLVFSSADAVRDFGYAPAPFQPDFKA